jgi:hypothetical protein
MKIDVDITTSIDLTHIEGRLEGRTLRIFEDHARGMLKAIKAQWVGWKYETTPIEVRGESRRSWRHTTQATQGVREITFINKAKSWRNGESYSRWVKRKKGDKEEWQIARARLLADHVPRMIDAVTASILLEVAPGPPRSIRKNESTFAVKFLIED